MDTFLSTKINKIKQIQKINHKSLRISYGTFHGIVILLSQPYISHIKNPKTVTSGECVARPHDINGKSVSPETFNKRVFYTGNDQFVHF